jgi:group I intron endonuclease
MINNSMIIYRITNNITTKSYVGQTISSLENRWKSHLIQSKRTNYKFHNAIRKYGPEAWTLDVLEEINDINILNDREIYWIAYYNTFYDGYNLTSGGEARKIVSEEIKEKIRQSHLGKKMPPRSEEHCEKIRQARLGKKRKPFSEETKKNMSLAHIGNKNRLGIPHSDETKRKMKESRSGKKRGPYKSRISH